ncbi:MAG: hypothetical protein HRU15_11540, partial [Planctomycetes bacterium]|nr:hypothetical protein [Planctomycetota bacterium]
PGSLCTYEPQAASDVYAMFQSLVDDQIMPKELLWKNTPEDKIGNIDYLMEIIDWEANVDPNFAENHFMAPKPVEDLESMQTKGYIDQWICYRSTAFSAKELTILPGHTVTISDAAAYGLIIMQGHGTIGNWDVECPALIRYGQLSNDEFFVSEYAAKIGIHIHNASSTDPLIMLKHFGPDNPDLKL